MPPFPRIPRFPRLVISVAGAANAELYMRNADCGMKCRLIGKCGMKREWQSDSKAVAKWLLRSREGAAKTGSLLPLSRVSVWTWLTAKDTMKIALISIVSILMLCAIVA